MLFVDDSAMITQLSVNKCITPLLQCNNDNTKEGMSSTGRTKMIAMCGDI